MTDRIGMTDRKGSAVVTLPSDREIKIVRQFDAPAELIFEAWTTPEHIRNWWGFESSPLVVCENDLQVGGKYRYVARDADGTESGWSGVTQELDPPHRMVWTEMFEAYPDAESLNTWTLTEEDGVTTLTIVILHKNREYRDGHVGSGLEGGLQHTLDRFDGLLARLDGDRAGAEA